MHKKVQAILLVLFMVAASAAVSGDAATIKSITVSIDRSGYVTGSEVISFDGDNGTVLLPAGSQIVSVLSSGIQAPYSTEERGNATALTVLQAEGKSVVVNYTSKVLTSKHGSEWTLKMYSATTKYNTIVKLDLPEKTDIISWEPTTLFTPMEHGIWLYPETEEFDLELKYRLNDDIIIKPPEPGLLEKFLLYVKENAGVIVITFLATFVLAGIWYTINKRRKGYVTRDALSEMIDEKISEKTKGPTQPEKEKEDSAAEKPEGTGSKKVKESVMNVLEDNERRVVEMIINARYDVTQSDISNETGLPKATLSDIMSRLERRNVIEREIDGRRKWVRLKNWVFE